MKLIEMLGLAKDPGEAVLSLLGLSKQDMGKYVECWVESGRIVARVDVPAVPHHYPGFGNFMGDECSCPSCRVHHRLPQNAHYLGIRHDPEAPGVSLVEFKYPREFARELRQVANPDPMTAWRGRLQELIGKVTMKAGVGVREEAGV
jgi:hypothetical protein